MKVKKIRIHGDERCIPCLVISPDQLDDETTGVLWIHGGGYMTGMKEMVFFSRAMDLVKKHNCVVVSPGYTLSFIKPYPAALDDCFEALVYMKEHHKELRIRSDQIMVGGESAGGGLCVATCLKARDTKKVNVAFQMPLYPMIDSFDTESSFDNHGKIWNTTRNHMAWYMYLRDDYKKRVSKYASPSFETNYKELPPCYSFVGDGEPFHDETIEYINNLKKENIDAKVDIYHCDMHAFDMMAPFKNISKQAILKFNEEFQYAKEHYFSKNED